LLVHEKSPEGMKVKNDRFDRRRLGTCQALSWCNPLHDNEKLRKIEIIFSFYICNFFKPTSELT